MFLLVIQLVVDEIVEREDRTNNTAKTGWGVTGFAASALGEIVAPGEVHGEHHVVGLHGECLQFSCNDSVVRTMGILWRSEARLDQVVDIGIWKQVEDVL